MKKGFPIFLVIVLFMVIGGCAKKEQSPIQIVLIQISSEEFEKDFLSSRFAQGGDKGRKDFLDNFISRKTMLLEAEKMGLDKDPEFLQDIQMFWEQNLLKLILDKKKP